MQHLLEGYRRFRSGRWRAEREVYAELSEGQRPRVMVVSCSDSRVDPAAIFDMGPGELFAVRNVANLVPPFEGDDGMHGTSAALEFAVKVLEVRTILVFGHSRCGGCQAALEGAPPEASDFLDQWISLLEPARDALEPGVDPLTAMERAAVRISLKNLMTFGFVAERVARGSLRLEGARFDIAQGALELMDPVTGEFSAYEAPV